MGAPSFKECIAADVLRFHVSRNINRGNIIIAKAVYRIFQSFDYFGAFWRNYVDHDGQKNAVCSVGFQEDITGIECAFVFIGYSRLNGRLNFVHFLIGSVFVACRGFAVFPGFWCDSSNSIGKRDSFNINLAIVNLRFPSGANAEAGAVLKNDTNPI